VSVMKDKSTSDVGAVKCDRDGCDAQGELDDNWMTVEYHDKKSGGLRNRLDFCRDCFQDFLAFAEGAEVQTTE
jgi:hypothetical protein